MNEAFEGTGEECLWHYLSSIDQAGKAVTQASLEKITGAHKKTVAGWLNGLQFPDGEWRIRVFYFLSDLGYCVQELERLPAAVRQLGKLYTVGAITFDQMVSANVISGQKYFRSIFSGEIKWGSKNKRLDVIKRFCENLGKGGEQQISPPKPEPHMITGGTIQPLAIPAPRKMDENILIIHTLAQLVLATIPLAERVASSDFTPSDRKKLHELTKETGIFQLSNLMSRLCSETARNNIEEKSKK